MSRRVVAALVVVGLLLMLPYWWPLLKESVRVITSDVPAIAQGINTSPSTSEPRPYTLEPVPPQICNRTYTFEVRYSDQEGNFLYVDGTNPEYVYVNGRVSETLWKRVELFFRRLFGRAAIMVDFQP